MSVELDGVNNVLKTDTISEVTSANGVTVDGLSIKDSKLVTANSVIEANMSANSVDSDSYVDGSIDTAHIADGQVTIGKLATAVLTGATDIGEAIVDADLFLVDNGAGGTLRKTAASRLKTFIGSGGKVGQVIQTTSRTATATTGGYTAMIPTGTITCAATSSKVLVQWSATIRLHGNDDTSTDKGYNLQLRRTPSGGSDTDYVFGGDTAYKFFYHALDTFGAAEQIRVQAHFIYLDSPSSTAALTYTPMLKVHQAQGTVCYDSTSAHLILTEVLA